MVCVGVVYGSDLFTGVCACVYNVFSYILFFVCAYHIFLFSARESAR